MTWLRDVEADALALAVVGVLHNISREQLRSTLTDGRVPLDVCGVCGALERADRACQVCLARRRAADPLPPVQ